MSAGGGGGAMGDEAGAAARFVIRGLVQAVGFRVSALAEAQRAGTAGWVRNRADGAVEMHVEGGAEGIEHMRRWAHRGPQYARVDDVIETEAEALGLDGFEIRR